MTESLPWDQQLTKKENLVTAFIAGGIFGVVMTLLIQVLSL